MHSGVKLLIRDHMKKFGKVILSISCICLSILYSGAQDKNSDTGSQSSLGEAEPVPTAEPALENLKLEDFFVFSKATFINELSNGIDPFFPTSNRRKKVAQAVEVQDDRPALDLSAAVKTIVLQGISWKPSNPVALINGVPFVENESRAINVNGRLVMIRCMKIRPTAALIKFIEQNEYKILEMKQE